MWRKERFVRFLFFFREPLGFLMNWGKQRLEGLKQFAGLNAKSLRAMLSSEKKVNVASPKGFSPQKQGHTESL